MDGWDECRATDAPDEGADRLPPLMTGYFGTPLAQKLGITPGTLLAVLDDPGHFLLLAAPLPPGVTVKTSARGKADTVVFFTFSRASLERRLDSLARMIFPDGGFWVCWPKHSSGVATDLTGNVVRDVILAKGLVDVKVAAIDDTWSGLRIVHRRENR